MNNNEIVVITGGSSGLGRALAERFVCAGACVALLARDRDKLNSVKEALTEKIKGEQKLECFSCDVADVAACASTLANIEEKLGAPTLLINSAGVLNEGYFDHLSLDDFRYTMEVNYFGAINVIHAALPYFDRNGGGRIVNIASLAGKFGGFGYAAYCGSKYAMVGLSDTLRLELKPRNITVQLVCPGEFETPMTQALEGQRSAENIAITQTIPPMTLDRVADEVFAGIQRGPYLIVPGRIPRLLEWLNRTLPGLMRWALDSKLKKIYQGPK